MVKAKEIFDTMFETYSASENHPIVVEDVGMQDSESYEIQYVAGNLILKADNPFGAILGWKKALQAVETGFIREHLGCHRPRFSLRMFQSGDACDAIKQGYNAVLCDKVEEIPPYRDMGLKVFLRVRDPAVEFGCADGIWVEGQLDEKEDLKTRIEILEEDLAKWEERTQGNQFLIYQLVHGVGETWTRWFLELCLKANKGTILAFSASCPESFWVQLRQIMDIIPTPMLMVADRDLDLSDRLVDHAFCGGFSKNFNSQFFLN